MNNHIKIKPKLKLVLIFCFFSVFLFGVLSFHLFRRVIEDFEAITLLILCILLISTFITSLFVIRFFSIIYVSENRIVIKKIFSKRTIHFKDIKSTIISEVIELNGFFVDRTQIKLINNELVNLYTFKYKNFHHLKIILNHLNEISNIENFKLKKLNLNIKNSKRQNYQLENGKTYNFSHILSFTGIVLYIFFLVISIKLISNENIQISDIFESMALLAFIFLLFSYNTNYFVITKNYLIVKNSILFWKKVSFELSEIESISINYYERQLGKTIVIKTKNFETISFISDNLINKNWKSFKDELKRNQILVSDNSDTPTRKILY